jgi:hypothetical protein
MTRLYRPYTILQESTLSDILPLNSKKVAPTDKALIHAVKLNDLIQLRHLLEGEKNRFITDEVNLLRYHT